MFFSAVTGASTTYAGLQLVVVVAVPWDVPPYTGSL